ncbi:hypothetical protein O3M35_003214 [Rhynocoris fuscipes]|uniref:Uncharacterized protein n=1 Tax=Rhynocoris fuscipes TaxID=488301 RepID=A0AAW1CLP5_9HEMI
MGPSNTSFPVKLWYKKYSETRKFYTTIIRLRLNHNYTLHHLFRIGIDINPICRCNTESIADSKYLIVDCNRYADGRDKLWWALRQTNLHTALRHDKDHLSLHLYKYIKHNIII